MTGFAVCESCEKIIGRYEEGKFIIKHKGRIIELELSEHRIIITCEGCGTKNKFFLKNT